MEEEDLVEEEDLLYVITVISLDTWHETVLNPYTMYLLQSTRPCDKDCP
jgi:hypothetical protein